jgi:hypothetical protein
VALGSHATSHRRENAGEGDTHEGVEPHQGGEVKDQARWESLERLARQGVQRLLQQLLGDEGAACLGVRPVLTRDET